MLDAYKIGVTLSLTNHVSRGLMMMAGDFAKTEAQATLLQKRIHSIKNDALKGGLLLGAGVGMLALFKGPLEEAKKFQTETAKFASLGFGDKVTAQAVKFAIGMNTVGTSARDNLTLLSDAMAVFKNIGHAEFAAPMMAKMKFANEAVFGQKGGEHSAKFMDMLKVIEFRGGLSSEKEFSTQANYVQQVISGSRNRVDATQLLSALKTGGVALSRRSNEQFYLGAEPLIQEFGGQRYGTGAMSIYQNLVQARGTATAQQELYRLGLLDPKMVEFNSLGKLKKAKAGAFYGSSILEQDGELALLKQVLLPAFAKKGISGDENIIREIGLILGNRTGSSLLSRIYQQRGQIGIQSAANRSAENIDQLSARAGGTLAGKEIDLHAKFNTLMLALGNTILPLAIKALEMLIPAVKSMAEWVGRNHGLVKGLAGAFIVLASGIAMRGAVLLLSAAFRGLGLALAFGAIGGASKIAALGSILMKFGSALVGMATAVMSNPWVMGILAAGGAGYAVGSLINKGINAGFGPNQSLGGWIYDKTHPSAGGSNFVAQKAQTPVVVNHTTQLDGRVLFKSNSYHAGKALSGPQFSTGKFDNSLMPRFAGAN